jgi:nitroreductase
MDFSEVIKRRRMFRQFTGEPLAPGTADRLLQAAQRAPSAGFTQGYSFLVLDGAEQCAPLWKILADAVAAGGGTEDEESAEVVALSSAQLVIVPLASKDAYLDGFDPRTLPGFRTQFGVPDEWMPVGAIAIGHPDRGNDPIPPLRPGERKPLAGLVHRGHW